jgi:methionyl aminopeptidase
MITIKTPKEIEILKEGGAILAKIIQDLAEKVKPGVSTRSLNDMAHNMATAAGAIPSFLNYTPDGATRPYPSSICISTNNEIVHGIPNEGEDKILQNGDIVSLDMGIIYKEMFLDHAITVPVGKIDKESRELILVTKNALQIGIDAARAGGNVGDIGYAIDKYVKQFPFSHAEGLAGHGVGYAVHEDPYVPNTGRKGTGPKLKPGMVIAIEPMLNLGTGKIKLDKDGYTYRTKDGKRSAHFEHTVLIAQDGPVVLTK